MPETANQAKRLLLLSSSIIHGHGYLDHAEGEIRDFLGPVQHVVFVPFAMHRRESYGANTRERFKALGYDLSWIRDVPGARRSIENAEALFIGGGNTFRLLKTLYEFDLLLLIRRRVDEGMAYIGSSAGSNVACPTIKTTNDMPIVQPPSFEALRLVNFQINPHYVDADPGSTHMGETREQRIFQFHEENSTPVVGLREAAMLRVEKGSVVLKGTAKARIFRQGMEPVEVPPECKLDNLLRAGN